MVTYICEYTAAAAAAKSLLSCPTLCDPRDGSPPGSPVPGILQASTGVGCHVLLQCMKVKSESEVAQSCLTLSDPMDCSLPGSSFHGIFQARVLEWGAIAFSDSSCRVVQKYQSHATNVHKTTPSHHRINSLATLSCLVFLHSIYHLHI